MIKKTEVVAYCGNCGRNTKHGDLLKCKECK